LLTKKALQAPAAPGIAHEAALSGLVQAKRQAVYPLCDQQRSMSAAANANRRRSTVCAPTIKDLVRTANHDDGTCRQYQISSA
jgi:hypothetical protein